jgi:uncharacterized membrane protein
MFKYGVLGFIFGVISVIFSFFIFTFVTGQWNKLNISGGKISALNLIVVLIAYAVVGCILGILAELGKKKK